MSAHVFDPEIAARVGLNAAVVYQNLRYWIERNAANNDNIRDGKVWTYNSVAALAKLFPYLTEKQIRTALEKLEAEQLIEAGNYNRSSYDRTKWYCLAGQSHSPIRADGSDAGVEPIPDVTTDHKPDVTTGGGQARLFDAVDPSDQGKDPEKETGKKAPRAARLPADWTLPDEWASWAVSQGLDRAKVRMEGERFRDYWTAAPGSKGVKADWLATWRNWCRSCMERMGLKPPAPDAKPADYSERIITNLAAYYRARAALSGRQMLDQEFRNKLDVAQQLAAGMDEAAKQALVVEAKRRAGLA